MYLRHYAASQEGLAQTPCGLSSPADPSCPADGTYLKRGASSSSARSPSTGIAAKAGVSSAVAGAAPAGCKLPDALGCGLGPTGAGNKTRRAPENQCSIRPGGRMLGKGLW